MALFSSRTLITARIVLFSFIAYHLLVSPRTIIEYSGVMVLASSMNLPMLMVNDKSPIYGSIGVVMISLIISDLGALLDNNVAYFETAIFIRLTFFLGLCVYCFLGTWVVLSNSIVFAYSFLEVWFGILTFSTLKEEKQNRIKDFVAKEADYRAKFDRGELSPEDEESYKDKVDKEEYEKIMSEFANPIIKKKI